MREDRTLWYIPSISRWSHSHTNGIKWKVGAVSIIVVVIRNEIGDSSSNSGWSCLFFISC